MTEMVLVSSLGPMLSLDSYPKDGGLSKRCLSVVPQITHSPTTRNPGPKTVLLSTVLRKKKDAQKSCVLSTVTMTPPPISVATGDTCHKNSG